MVKKNYAKAYTEVLKVLEYVPKDDVKKIPEKIISFYSDNQDKEYDFDLDYSKDFFEQNISLLAKKILYNLFINYWVTPEQRQKLLENEKETIKKLEEIKRKRYNPNDIFN